MHRGRFCQLMNKMKTIPCQDVVLNLSQVGASQPDFKREMIK